MSEIARTKREYKQHIEPEYNRVVGKWKNGHMHREEAAMELLHILEVYFNHMRTLACNDEPWFDIESLIEIVKGDKTYKTERTNYQIGCFVYALWLLGSSKLQAYKAMARWLGKKTSYYKKCLELFERKGLYKDITDSEYYIYLNSYLLRKILDSAENPFPNRRDIAKARRAYEHLLVILTHETVREIKFQEDKK